MVLVFPLIKRFTTSHDHECCSMSDDAAKTLSAQAFISCRLDYCNALLCGISDGLVQRCSRYKMRQLGWSLELVDESTSRRC